MSRYPFDDHNPPTMSLFLPFCQDVVRAHVATLLAPLAQCALTGPPPARPPP